MWLVVGIVAGLGFIVLVPVLVVGTWVVMTVILGLADRTIWLLDQGTSCWIRGERGNGKLPLLVEGLPRGRFGEDVDAESGAGGPRTTLKKAA